MQCHHNGYFLFFPFYLSSQWGYNVIIPLLTILGSLLCFGWEGGNGVGAGVGLEVEGAVGAS